MIAVNEYNEAALIRQDYVSKDTYVCVAGHIKFNKKILKYTIGNKEEKEKVFDECRKFGIPDSQLDLEE